MSGQRPQGALQPRDLLVGANTSPASSLSFEHDLSGILPLGRMGRDRESFRAAYGTAKPYPHVVMDGLFDEAVLDRVVAEFPKRDGRDWINYDNPNELKQTSRGIFGLSPFTQLLCLQLFSRLGAGSAFSRRRPA
jgi:hypothetical protein